VVPSPDRGDELLRWARERAPAVLAEAEREATRMLRDALVDAATRNLERRRTTTPRAPSAPVEPAADGDLLWAYCVLRDRDAARVGVPGVDPSRPVEAEQDGELVVLVSRVPRAEFAAEPLRRNLNDLAWLERVARAHEAVLESVLDHATLVPLRMCTLYESPEGVRAMLRRERADLIQSLATLEGRLEWAVKVTADRERLLDGTQAAGGDQGAAPAGGEGGAYLKRRQHERELRAQADSLAAGIAEQVHARLQDWAIDGVSRPPQNPELSGHEGQMLLNAAYLVDRSRTEELRQLVSELEDRYRELGARIELTGPWPPYNFVSRGPSAVL
jgi:hypothetical protein